jgi:hypothetical protein
MRLYRGLRERYRPERVVPTPERPAVRTDFTDCPLTALQYASGPRGVVLVLDVPAEALDARKFSEELWLGMGSAKRFMAWGKFDKFITTMLPAKELRAFIRVKGVAGAADECKAALLRRKIQERLDEAARERRGGGAPGLPKPQAAFMPDRR